MKQSRLPSLAALRAFETVARAGSIKEAAAELCVTPGAVSQLIKKLEDELSIPLFERKKREMLLTKEGCKLRDGAFDAFRLLKETVNSLSSRQNPSSLTIACDSSITHHWLVPRLSQILAIDPAIDIEIQSFDNVDQIMEKAFDIVLCRYPVQSNQYAFNCLGSENFTVLTSPEYVREMREVPKSLLTSPVLLNVDFPDSCAAPTWSDWFDAVHLDACQQQQSVFFGEALDNALDAAKNSTGLILAPLTLVSKDIEAGRLINPYKTHLKSNLSYWLGFDKTNEDSPTVTTIKNWIADEIRQSITAQHQTFTTQYQNNVYEFVGSRRV